MQVSIRSSRLGLRNSTTRIPFRYGSACLVKCPQAILEVQVECGGNLQPGYSGDCLPPSWFDKSPDRDYAGQIDDMLAVIALTEQTFSDRLAEAFEWFPAWLDCYHVVHAEAERRKLTPLLASFGISMVERAVMDAMARSAGLSFADAVRQNIYGIDAGKVHPTLVGIDPKDWLPGQPLRSIYVRHTVGLGDPLTTADLAVDERLDDGFPQTLEQYIKRTGTKYFKIKVSNQHDHDVERLKAIAALIELNRGADYRVTLDGNEQYKRAEQFDQLMASLRATPDLATLLDNTLAIEQPLDRHIALDFEHTSGIRELARWRPVIIDESDATLDSYPLAIELGYRGVSSKNCKGPMKSLLNAGLTWLHNGRGTKTEFLMTGEDLCSVGIVPTQADLCLAATLGLTHVERNGHHYHPGLSYLPKAVRESALAEHGDFYARQNGVISPQLVDGRFEIGSLQCVGFGFGVMPDVGAMQSPDQWDFSSLGF